MEWLSELANERPALLARYICCALIAIIAVIVIAVKKKKKPTHTDVSFDLPQETTCFTLENQNEKTDVYEESSIENYFADFMSDEEQFIILKAPKPINNISFIQACHTNGKIELEIAVVKDGKNNLFYKYCNDVEALSTFLDFYNGRFASNQSQYKPVEFYCKGGKM